MNILYEQLLSIIKQFKFSLLIFEVVALASFGYVNKLQVEYFVTDCCIFLQLCRNLMSL